MSACYSEFQVSKYLQLSGFHATDDFQQGAFNEFYDYVHLVVFSDASLRLLMMAPLQLFTKTQKLNVANRLLHLLTDRSMGRYTISAALNMLILFMEAPSNTMIMLKDPYLKSDESVSGDQGTTAPWLFEIAAWLDEASHGIGPDVQAVIKLKQLAVLILQSVHASHCQLIFF